MRYPTDKELKCILYAREMYPPRYKDRNLIQKITFQKPIPVKSDFDINKCVVGETKSLRDLWVRFGLMWSWSNFDIHGNFVERTWEKDGKVIGKGLEREFQNKWFSEEENINCINYWINILYEKKLDLRAMLEKDKNEIADDQKRISEEAIRTNSLRKRVNYGCPIERLIYSLDEILGNYD